MYIFTTSCWTFCHCSHLQYHDTCEVQNAGVQTTVEEDYIILKYRGRWGGEKKGDLGGKWGNAYSYRAVKWKIRKERRRKKQASLTLPFKCGK